jgi:predicted MFS family arabinose efflux permease
LPSDFEVKWIRIFLWTQFFANLFVNVDMGILPASSTKIKQQMGLDNTMFGFLGSIVYLGQTIGSIMSTGLLQKGNTKVIMSTCLFFNVFSLVLFTLTDVYIILVICRMCTGLFQVVFCIYFPVWADVFGNDVQKSTWLTYLLIASPLGVILGYGMAAFFLNNIGW